MQVDLKRAKFCHVILAFVAVCTILVASMFWIGYAFSTDYPGECAISCLAKACSFYACDQFGCETKELPCQCFDTLTPKEVNFTYCDGRQNAVKKTMTSNGNGIMVLMYGTTALLMVSLLVYTWVTLIYFKCNHIITFLPSENNTEGGDTMNPIMPQTEHTVGGTGVESENDAAGRHGATVTSTAADIEM